MKRVLLIGISLFTLLSSYSQDTTTCVVNVIDTVRYINNLSSGFQGTSINISNGTGGTAGYAGYAQLFEAPDSITLKGFCFYGLIEGPLPDTVDAELFLANGAGGSPGTLLESVRVGVPDYVSYTGVMNSPAIRRCAEFSSPIEMEGNYFLSIRNVTDANIFMAINYDGNAEATPSEFTYYHEDAGTYTGWYDLGAFGAGWGFNPIIEPIVEYSFSATTIANDSLLCSGDTLNLQMSIAEGDSAFFNKFYNPNYSSYTGLFSSNIVNYGDGSSNTIALSHEYNAEGTYTVTRDFNIVTPIWTQSSMVISCNGSVRVVDASVDLGSDTSVCSGTVLSFDAGSVADSYLWQDMSTSSSFTVDTDTLVNGMYNYYVTVAKEFCAASDTLIVTVGDLLIDLGNDTTLCLNQSISLAAGSFDTYNWNTGQTTQQILVGPFTAPSIESYMLTVTDGNCVGVDTLVLTVDNCLGVEEESQMEISLFPNPSNGYFTIDLSKINAPNGNITVIDNTGRVVFSKTITNLKEDISISDLTAGSYFVNVSVNGNQIMKKIQIIN